MPTTQPYAKTFSPHKTHNLFLPLSPLFCSSFTPQPKDRQSSQSDPHFREEGDDGLSSSPFPISSIVLSKQG